MRLADVPVPNLFPAHSHWRHAILVGILHLPALLVLLADLGLRALRAKKVSQTGVVWNPIRGTSYRNSTIFEGGFIACAMAHLLAFTDVDRAFDFLADAAALVRAEIAFYLNEAHLVVVFGLGSQEQGQRPCLVEQR